MKKLLLILLFVPFIYCSSDSGSEATTPPPTTTTPPPVVNYTLTVSAGDGGAVSSTGGTYASGESVSITATANYEYVFSGWSNGSANNPLSVAVSSDQTITASFEALNIEGVWKTTSAELDNQELFGVTVSSEYIYLYPDGTLLTRTYNDSNDTSLQGYGVGTYTINTDNTITTEATAYNPDGSVLQDYNLVWDIPLFNATNLNIQIYDYPAAGNVYIKKHVKTDITLPTPSEITSWTETANTNYNYLGVWKTTSAELDNQELFGVTVSSEYTYLYATGTYLTRSYSDSNFTQLIGYGIGTYTINSDNAIKTIRILATAYNPDGSPKIVGDLVSDITLSNGNNFNFETTDYPAAGNVYIKKHIKADVSLPTSSELTSWYQNTNNNADPTIHGVWSLTSAELDNQEFLGGNVGSEYMLIYPDGTFKTQSYSDSNYTQLNGYSVGTYIKTFNTIRTVATAYNPDGSVLQDYDVSWGITLFNRNNLNIQMVIGI